MAFRWLFLVLVLHVSKASCVLRRAAPLTSHHAATSPRGINHFVHQSASKQSDGRWKSSGKRRVSRWKNVVRVHPGSVRHALANSPMHDARHVDVEHSKDFGDADELAETLPLPASALPRAAG